MQTTSIQKIWLLSVNFEKFACKNLWERTITVERLKWCDWSPISLKRRISQSQRTATKFQAWLCLHSLPPRWNFIRNDSVQNFFGPYELSISYNMVILVSRNELVLYCKFKTRVSCKKYNSLKCIVIKNRSCNTLL